MSRKRKSEAVEQVSGSEQEDSRSEDYEVEEILEKRAGDNGCEYLVTWVGFSDQTWLHESELGNCNEIVQDFENKNPEQQKQAPVQMIKKNRYLNCYCTSNNCNGEVVSRRTASRHIAEDRFEQAKDLARVDTELFCLANILLIHHYRGPGSNSKAYKATLNSTLKIRKSRILILKSRSKRKRKPTLSTVWTWISPCMTT